MSKNIVYAGQSFLDKVLECTGSIENAFDMAILNNVMITDDAVVGSELKIIAPTNKVIFDYFNNKNRPATNIIQQQISELQNFGFPYGFPINF